MRRSIGLGVACLIGVVAACGGDDTTTRLDVATTVAATPTTTEAPPTTTEAPEPEPEIPVEMGWVRVDAPDDCMCADGSPYAYFVRAADPTKVVFYLEGGGACFSAETCTPGTGPYKQIIGFDQGLDGMPGIFDIDNVDNPLRDYSMVFVPYCTGDVHSGNTTKDYGNGVVIEHKGFVNGRAVLDDTLRRFPNVSTVFVSGSSAGAFPTPIYAGLFADRLPDADIKVFADSGGAIPDAMSFVVDNWGTLDALPDWPEFDGVSLATFTPANSFVVTARRHPRIAFARHDYAFDEVLANYALLAGLTPDDLMGVMRRGEEQIEATGSSVATWIGPGRAHTILANDRLYAQEMNGVRFVEWLRAFVNGSPLADQYCVECR